MIYQTCGAPQNMGHYCDKEVDAWHQRGAGRQRPRRPQGDLREDHRAIPGRRLDLYLYHPQYLIAYTDRLEGFKPMPDGLMRVVGVKLK